MFYTIFAQITTAAVEQAPVVAQAATATAEENLSFLDLLFKGGFVMYPIILLSFMATYLFVERLMYIRRASRFDDKIIFDVVSKLEKGDLKAAVEYCENNNYPFAKMMEKALHRVGSPISDIESILQNMASVEVAKMEKNIGLISAIAAIAPMLGFLGTVFGMITTFHDISVSNDISMGIIANGIYQKMITSASGLIVGITAYCYYTYINNRIDRAATSLEMNTITFIDAFYNPAK
jgi:biopolymer transport protein ExbB